MRKILITLLLASAAASPAIAGHRDWADGQQAQNNSQQVYQERAQARSDRSAERPSYAAPAREQFQAERQQFAQRPQFNGGARVEAQGEGFTGGRNAYAQRDAYAAYAAQREAYAQQRGAYAQERGAYAQQRGAYGQQRGAYYDPRSQYYPGRDFRQSNRAQPNVMRDRNPLVVSNVPRPGTQPPMRADSRRVEELNWNRNWRNDQRYDWRDYRNHHRSRFHLNLYVDPFGWGYQPYGIGWRMWPAYYGNQFWLDPSMYELPFPPPGCVWVRYWNDALLVDTFSGSVVDVIPGFFW